MKFAGGGPMLRIYVSRFVSTMSLEFAVLRVLFSEIISKSVKDLETAGFYSLYGWGTTKLRKEFTNLAIRRMPNILSITKQYSRIM